MNLRPASDWPDRDIVVFDPGRIVRILRRIAADLHELARARHVADLTSAEADEHPVRRRRRRYSEPDIEQPSGRLSIPQAQRAWDATNGRCDRPGSNHPPTRTGTSNRARAANHIQRTERLSGVFCSDTPATPRRCHSRAVVTSDEIHDAGDVVVVERRAIGKTKTGKVLDARVCWVWTARDGLTVANYNNHDTDAWRLALDTVNAAERQPLPYVID